MCSWGHLLAFSYLLAGLLYTISDFWVGKLWNVISRNHIFSWFTLHWNGKHNIYLYIVLPLCFLSYWTLYIQLPCYRHQIIFKVRIQRYNKMMYIFFKEFTVKSGKHVNQNDDFENTNENIFFLSCGTTELSNQC